VPTICATPSTPKGLNRNCLISSIDRKKGGQVRDILFDVYVGLFGIDQLYK
jgi:hypothetical protein